MIKSKSKTWKQEAMNIKQTFTRIFTAYVASAGLCIADRAGAKPGPQPEPAATFHLARHDTLANNAF